VTHDLRGREAELSVLRRTVSRLPERPGVLVVRGGAGVGKSSLLAAAVREAAARGFDTLELVGVQSEFRMPFAAALTLLGMLGGTEPAPHAGDDERKDERNAQPYDERNAQPYDERNAQPYDERKDEQYDERNAEPYEFRLGLALLHAATARAAERPLLIVADDAQWLDAASWEAMSFAGRRIESDPVVVLLGMRDGAEADARLFRVRARELRVEPLSERTQRHC
jgi:hypothetical protein